MLLAVVTIGFGHAFALFSVPLEGTALLLRCRRLLVRGMLLAVIAFADLLVLATRPVFCNRPTSAVISKLLRLRHLRLTGMANAILRVRSGFSLATNARLRQALALRSRKKKGENPKTTDNAPPRNT